MRKNAGLLLLLLAACALTAIANPRFLNPINIENLFRRTALFSILSIGVSFAITSGGIDLAIGSMVCLVGTLLPWLCVEQFFPPLFAVLLLLAVAALLGLAHGLLITKLKLQPFIVTLCGLLLYRGVTRGITGDQTQGFGMAFESLRAVGQTRFSLGIIELPSIVFIAAAIALLASVAMNFMPFGLALRALGRNDVAAFYSGLRTTRLRCVAYTLSATLAGLGGIFFILDVNSAQPSDFGNFYELYAIAAAVLGGCSLRGGEWSIAGILIGTTLMQVLRNAIVLLDVPTQLEFAIIGIVILVGVSAEEIFKKIKEARKTHIA